MDDRKRPASHEADDPAPPQKRQATSAPNGGAKGNPDDMPGRDELEKFQKEAILRQMREYKREKGTVETQLNDLAKKAAFHDDHLRAVDAWLEQLLDEVKISLGQITEHSKYQPFPSALLSADPPTFNAHLRTRARTIITAINRSLSSDKSASPGVSEFQQQVAKLQAERKTHVAELERIRLEIADMDERCEEATMRYMVAEKKSDRAKSSTVQKLERQAIGGGRSESGSGLGGATEGTPGGKEMTNGLVNDEALAETERARKEALALSAKQAEHIDQLAADNERLNNQITSMHLRLSSLSDDDYAQSELFKQLKHQYEDLVNKMNRLEAINKELRSEAQKLKEERSSYKMQLDTEMQASIGERDLALSKAENDLARIRTARDELTADLQMRRASQEQEKNTTNQIKQILAAKEDRIAALESEMARLNPDEDATSKPDVDTLPVDELRLRYATLEKQYTMLNKELSSMSAAYKKMSITSTQKLNTASDLEEKMARLTAEKAKADQKYFAAMKNKEAKEQEVRTLRAQNSKSTEIVSQLKEAEAATSNMVSVLEKQMAESRASLASLEAKHHTVQGQLKEKSLSIEGFQKQTEDLKKAFETKDTAYSTALTNQRKAEVEAEKLKVDAEEKARRLELWHSKGLGSNDRGDDYERIKQLLLCGGCRSNFKNTVITSCGHLCCTDCVDKRLKVRQRRCPICNKSFGAGDHLRVVLQ